MLNDLNLTPDDIVFLQELAEELRTQDNRITAEPLFCVQTKRKVWTSDEFDYDGFEYYDTSACEFCDEDDIVAYLEELRQEAIENGTYDSDSDDYEFDPEYPQDPFVQAFYKVHYETVTVHFTEKAANSYMESNRHNLNDPRVYVTSQYRAREWNRVREILLKL